MKQDDRVVAVTFYVSNADLADLKRAARRLAYPNVEPLAAELFRLGFQILEQRFEPMSRAGAFLRARETARATDADFQAARRRRARRTPDDSDREGRRDRVLRRHGLDV